MIARERSFGAGASRMIGALRAGLMAAVLVISCSDHGGAEHVASGTASVGGGVAPEATTVAKEPSGFARTDAGAFVGFHLGPQFSSTIDDRGAQLAGLDATWTTGLHVARIGRAGAMREVERSAPSATKERVEVARGGGVTEWFALRDRGLEHGIDLSAPPAGKGELVIEVAVEGRTAVAAADGQQVKLRDAGDAPTLTYGELSVKDADGRDVAARMSVVGGTVTMAVLDEGARYPLVVDPLVWAQQAKVVATDGGAKDAFGTSVALSGPIAVVGAPNAKVGASAKQGATYVFVQSGTTWTQQAVLTATDGAKGDAFGSSVALIGTTAVVGAPMAKVGINALQGVAYVFVQSGTSWTQQARLAATAGGASEIFGSSVALSGSTAIVGAPNAKIGTKTNQGAAYVFVQSGTAWSQQDKLVAIDGAQNDRLGSSVAISGPTAIVGSISNKGGAYIFAQGGTAWSQQVKLATPDAVLGTQFGSAVAINGSTAVVGASNTQIGTNTFQGAVYVFAQSGTTWAQQAQLAATDAAADDYFGTSVAISGTTIAVGTIYQKIGVNRNQGGAYVFVQSGSTWAQQGRFVAIDGGTNDYFGNIAIDGTTALVGAFKATVGSNVNQGAAYVFVYAEAKPNTCTSGSDCPSGFCAEVCCDRACNGKCEACTTAKKGSGVDGICGFVPDGVDPNASCGPPMCAAKTLTEHVCDGKGACRDKATSCAPVDCDPAGRACLKKCATNDECGAGSSCVNGVCAPAGQTPAGTTASKSGCGCVMPGTTRHGQYPWTIATLGILAVLTRARHRRRRVQSPPRPRG